MYDGTIGKRIKEIRLAQGMTQQQVGNKCGMPDSAIRKYELGTQTPKVSTLQRIADALDTDIYYLLTGVWEFDLLASKRDIEKVKVTSTATETGNLLTVQLVSDNQTISQSDLSAAIRTLIEAAHKHNIPLVVLADLAAAAAAAISLKRDNLSMDKLKQPPISE
jgi:transcriptional regulator with XRE-family HTH domain